MTTTDRDIRDQVTATLAGDCEIYDVRGITRELVDTFDLTGPTPTQTVGGIDAPTYWAVVGKYQHPDA